MVSIVLNALKMKFPYSFINIMVYSKSSFKENSDSTPN